MLQISILSLEVDLLTQISKYFVKINPGLAATGIITVFAIAFELQYHLQNDRYKKLFAENAFQIRLDAQRIFPSNGSVRLKIATYKHCV